MDEFQNFATDSFATILSEARKYRLSLTLANQYLAQMDEATAAAVFGNVGSLLVFQVGATDAEPLAEQLGGDVTPQDLLALPRYTAYARLLIDGMPSRPFSMETLPPPRHNENRMRSDDHPPHVAPPVRATGSPGGSRNPRSIRAQHMSKASSYSPALQYLAKLWLGLRNNLGRLNRKVFRFLSEGRHDGLLPPTLHNVQQIRADIDQLREEIDPYDA